jgi:hypothetical protein
MEDNFLDTLKEKEREVFNELKKTPLYKQWEGIKTTISLFEGKDTAGVTEADLIQETPNIEYDPNFTWAEKVLYGVSKIGSGFVPDIIKEIKKVDPDEDDELMEKRVGNMVSVLISKGKLHIIQKSGRKIKVAKK